MEYLRTFILVLLTVLLPIRGAVAAAMLCPGEASTLGAGAAAGHGDHDRHASHDRGGQHAATHDHSHDHASEDTTADAHATACQFCAGGCCVTPLAFAPPSVASPLQFTSATFPALDARITAHCADGQDRPPRSF